MKPAGVEGTAQDLPSAVKSAALSPRSGWFSLGLLVLLFAFSFLDRQIIALLVEPIRQDLGISDFQVSLLQGLAFAMFYAVFGLPLGWAVDRYARPTIVFWGVFVWSLATTACGFAQRFWVLALARFGVGAGEAALSPAAYSILADAFPRERLALVLSIFGTGAVIGSSVAIAGGGLLIAAIPTEGLSVPGLGHVAAWQAVFIFVGAPGLLIAPLAFLIRDPVRRDKLEVVRPSFANALAFMRERKRFYLCHFTGFGLVSLTGYGQFYWIPTYLMRHYQWTVAEVGSALALMMLIGNGIGAVVMGAVVDSWFKRGRTDAHLVFFAIAVLVQTVLVAAAIGSPRIEIFWIFLSGSAVFSAFTGVAAAALQIVTPNEFRGQVSATYLFLMSLIGLGLGPSAVAAFTDFLFRDDGMVGWAIVLNFAIFGPLAAVAFLIGAPAMRQCVAKSAEWTNGSRAS